MSFIKFLFSKTFLIQIALAILALVVIAFLVMQWLNFSTNQDQRIEVPDLTKLTLNIVDERLDELDLRYEILDSANYNPDYPRYAVIEQVPAPGSYVKENRKIYLTLNPSGYRKVTVPDLIRRTRRQAEPTLRSLGFEIGDITYKPDFAIDAVLELRHKGRLVNPGDELMKTSVIDLVLGDGQDRFRLDGEEDEDDSLDFDDEPFEEDFDDEF